MIALVKYSIGFANSDADCYFLNIATGKISNESSEKQLNVHADIG